MSDISETISRTASTLMQKLHSAFTLASAPHLVDEDENQILMVPDNYSALSLDEFRHDRLRAKDHIIALDEKSFIELIRFNDGQTSHQQARCLVYADAENLQLTAILNDHAEAPAWRDHKVTLKLRPDPAWSAWNVNDQDRMAQERFAEFVDDHIEVFLKPDGARMLEVAMNLRAKRELVFGSGVNLQNGDLQFTYQENTEAGAGKSGRLQIPEQFEIALPVFQGGQAFKLSARFIYRVTDAKLHLGYRLRRPDLIERAAFDQVCDQVRGADINLVMGRP